MLCLLNIIDLTKLSRQNTNYFCINSGRPSSVESSLSFTAFFLILHKALSTALFLFIFSTQVSALGVGLSSGGNALYGYGIRGWFPSSDFGGELLLCTLSQTYLGVDYSYSGLSSGKLFYRLKTNQIIDFYGMVGYARALPFLGITVVSDYVKYYRTGVSRGLLGFGLEAKGWPVAVELYYYSGSDSVSGFSGDVSLMYYF